MSQRWMWMGLLLLTSCQTVHPPAHTPPPLPLLPAPAVEEAAPELPLAERDLLIDSEPAWPQGNPLVITTKAMKRATVTASPVGFERGMLVYPYRAYSVYRADVNARGSLHIQLPPGEDIRIVSGYRKVDWTVQREDAVTSLESSHLVVTPNEANLDAHLILVTSKATYYVNLRSHESQGLYGITWKHPPRVAR